MSRARNRRARAWLASTLTGGGGVSIPLAAKYQGGKELHDGTGHLPRDADGYYLSRTTGERLVIDEGYAETDAVGVARLRDVNGAAPSAVAAGTPEDERASGVSGLTTANYYANNAGSVMASDPDRWTLLVRAERDYSTTTDTVIEMNGQNTGNQPGPRIFLGPVSTFSAYRVRFRTAVGVAFDESVSSRSAGTNGDVGMALRIDRVAGTYAIHTYEDGVSFNNRTGSATLTGVPWDGGVVLGSTADGLSVADLARNRGLRWALWERELTQAECDAAMALGADSFGQDADHFWDGAGCGAYDADNPTELPTLSGTGADVVVERPT